MSDSFVSGKMSGISFGKSQAFPPAPEGESLSDEFPDAGHQCFPDTMLPEGLQKKFLLAVLENRLIHSGMMNASDAMSVFMPIMLGGLTDFPRSEIAKVAFIYGILGEDKTCNMAINGWPIFISCRIMLESDWKVLKPKVEAILELKRSATGEEKNG